VLAGVVAKITRLARFLKVVSIRTTERN
jgi:hypothetical protein